MRTEPRPRLDPGLTVVLWVVSVLVLVVLFAAAWVWCGMSYEEQFSEESKAQAAGMTMAGWGFSVGLVPVLVVHALAVVGAFLVLRAGGRTAWPLALLCSPLLVTALSLPGFIAVQLLYGGSMFEPPVYVP